MPPDDGSAWLQDNALKILDAAVDAIIIIDALGMIHSVNAATSRMFGHEAQALLNQPVGALMPEPHRSAHQSFIEHYLRTGNAKIIGIGRELTAQKADGSRFPISLAISEINTGSERYFAGVIRDLTEQKDAMAHIAEQRERLAQVGRLSTMGEMTASIAHEINQPLTAIAMYSQACQRLLDRERLDRDKLAEALGKLSKQALRAGAVIERIQRFVRNEDGQREWTDLSRLLRELILLTEPDAKLHSIALAFDVDRTIMCHCDPVQIQQVVINLIRNAIDAMYTQGSTGPARVRVELHEADQQALIRVIDSGPGIADDDADAVFEAFHSTKADGMGMGLSICRSIAEAHRGALSFTNNPDAGCTFELRLPLDETDD
ncbi:MAG: ATP-binding protein [Pseudomonadota bacterium]